MQGMLGDMLTEGIQYKYDVIKLLIDCYPKAALTPQIAVRRFLK